MPRHIPLRRVNLSPATAQQIAADRQRVIVDLMQRLRSPHVVMAVRAANSGPDALKATGLSGEDIGVLSECSVTDILNCITVGDIIDFAMLYGQ